MGYKRVVTYTLESESGASLRAIGAKVDGKTRPQGWNNSKRKREDQEIYFKVKNRWIV